MAGAEDGHQPAAWAVGAGLHLAGQRIELADRALEVLLADLVVGRRGHRAGIHRLGRSSLRLHHALREARLTRRSRRARRAGAGSAVVSRNFSAWT